MKAFDNTLFSKEKIPSHKESVANLTHCNISVNLNPVVKTADTLYVLSNLFVNLGWFSDNRQKLLNKTYHFIIWVSLIDQARILK